MILADHPTTPNHQHKNTSHPATCFRAFCDPGAAVVLTQPTYPVLHDLARIPSADVVASPIPMENHSAVTPEAPLRFVVNPNAPTGA
ncbi:MAG: hypothetical protein ACRDYA_11395 [Egibacteraceae bacterium]